MTRYLVYDVFTDRPFGGNPLAIFPDASALPDDQLQPIARAFNYSETTFVFPPRDPAHTARVRIFTPTMEIPFAGHPTIGTALALRAGGAGDRLTLELGVGPIPCRCSDAGAEFATQVPLEHVSDPATDLVARALSLPARAIRTDVHAPIQASLGLPFVIAQLTDRAALSAASPDLAAIRDGAGTHPVGHDFSLYAYVRNGDTIHARMFAPLDNIPEDAATGSAAATVTALLAKLTGMAQTLTIHQGIEMGRPSVITTRSDDTAVYVAGQAVPIMEGRLVF